MAKRKIRVLVAKPGLDGHDVGAKVVVRALVDAGFEVIYTGLRQSPEAIAEASRDEDVDVIALSILSGSHIPICQRLKVLLDEYGLGDKLWIIGGNVPDQDHDTLREIGLDAVFNTGARLDEIVRFIKEKALDRAA
ncbi:MAG: cobalamin-dependent protein [Alphaproteobacteria bacterium]|nr:cobalamin-dependent protein [Alphaproteobacteria bacterium]